MSRALSFLILFFLCFCQLINADPSNEINSTENFISGDEESLATVNNCVNVVTGSFFQVDHDLVVDGPETLRFVRCYDSGHLLNSIYGFGFGSQYPLKIGRFWKGKNHYHAAIETQEGSYFEFKGEHFKGKKEVRVFLDSKIFKLGLSNYSDHEISAHTNMDNVRAKFTYVDKNKEVGKWDVNYPDGSCRKYLGFQTPYLFEKVGLLYMIQHPKGNRTMFGYPKDLLEAFQISRNFSSSFHYIYNVNAAGEKLNRIDHHHILFGDCSFNGYQMVGSNGQCVNYKIANETHTLRTKYGKERENFLVLKEVSAPHLPTTTYSIDESGKKGGFFKIGQVERPDGRFLQIAYNSKGKVKELKAPVGKTSEPLIAYTFDYCSKGDEKLTVVTNALGAKTHYRINKNKRIKSVEDEINGRLYCSKDFFWNDENGCIKGKAYRVNNRQVNKAIKYFYDNRGNIVEEIFFGNLTGNGDDLFSKNFDGNKISGNPESCSTYSTYSNDRFNLKLSEADDFGLKTLYSYQPSTNLLTKEFVLHHDQIQKRIFYTYDASAVLIKTIEDNGSSDDANNLTGVTERLITTIIPINDHLPSLGKPAEIKESYYDPETKQECLLHCTKCAYSPHGFLKKKDVFDANMTFVYSEMIEYDERDLVIKTVNALGEETCYDYNANHDKIYEENIGSKKSTHYAYNFMNRLIQVKEQHDDGCIFITEHQYDRVGNCIATIDSYGNKITYVYDTLNRLTETRYPPHEKCRWRNF